MLELYTIFARNMPEFYIRPYVFLQKNIFSGIFFLGGDGATPWHLPGAGPQAPHQLNPALHSMMAVSRHLGCYRTGNSAIRSANLENPRLKPNIE